MSPKWFAGLLCLMLLGQAVAKNVTAEQLAIMRKGLEAGRKFTEVLQKGTFQQFVAKAETFAPSFTDAIGVVFDILGALAGDTKDDILDEVKKGFGEVNMNLDRVIQKIGELKKLIDWRDMQVRFGDIEYRIRLLDDTLRQVLRAPDRRASIGNFKKVYRREYSSAGFALYDAVANNDQVFSRNLLTAAIKYSDVHRNKTQGFSRGLFGLLMKATCIEMANEKFSKINLGMNVTWIERLQQSRKAIKAADEKVATEAWKPQVKIDVDALAKQLKTIGNNQQFANMLYSSLTKKYPWRYFLVVAFEASDSTQCQASVLPDHGTRGLKKHDRSYFVASTDPNSEFDPVEAYFYARNYVCSKSGCGRDYAVWMMRLSPDYGVARMVVGDHFLENWGFIAKEGRYVMRNAALTDSAGYSYHNYKFIYFG